MSSPVTKRVLPDPSEEGKPAKKQRINLPLSGHPAIDASVHDYSQGNTHIFEGDSNIINYGATFQNTYRMSGLETRIENLKRSHNAEYDMVANSARGPCTPETRLPVLQKIFDWSQTGDAPLFWLSGMAGTGKTSISYSASEKLEEMDLLGASFFCSRSLPDCRDVRLIFPTIAVQLSRRYPAFAEALASALDSDPDINQRTLNIQLNRLIIQPWAERKSDLPEPQAIVVVLDALDECDEDHTKLLQLFFDNAFDLPFKVLITSRPESSIRDAMKARGPNTLSTFILHDVEDDLVRADIVKYLQSKLSHRIALDVIDRIADLAGSLFIYAAIVCRLFISGHVDILARLQVLQDTSPTRDKSKLLAPLDDLYRGVLAITLSNELLDIERQQVKGVLDIIVCARQPLTRQVIGELLGVEEDEVNRRLDMLYSIISVPQNSRQPITVLHASLPDFMLDSSRSGELYCDPVSVNLSLTQKCLVIMDSKLRPNLCQVDGRPANHSIGLDTIDNCITPGLRYASIYFSEHWMMCDHSSCHQEHTDLIRHFLTKHLLCWSECLGLLDKLVTCVHILETLLSTLFKDADLATLVYDFLRLIQFMYDCIKLNSLEIYRSALTWLPVNSPLRTHYKVFFERAPRVLYGLTRDWTGPEQVIDSSDLSQIGCLAISQDGKQMAFVSGKKTIKMWNTRHQIEDCVLNGHDNTVTSLAISSDAGRVVSGSRDRTFRVWNTASHQATLTFRVPSAVLSVALSQDEKWIASGHMDHIFRIWDATIGKLYHSFHGHEGWITSSFFVPKTPHLVISGSTDFTVRAWDIHTRIAGHILVGHCGPVSAVACSPDGDKIVSGSTDKTVRVWATSGDLLHVLQSLIDEIMFVTFMPGGGQVLAGSGHGLMCVWDITTGEVTRTLAPREEIRSIAIFPDGQRVACAAKRRIVVLSMREAILNRNRQGTELPGTASLVCQSMEFSSNGQRVVLFPSLRILDISTLAEVATLRHGLSSYNLYALSLSGSLVAAVTTTDWIEVWELSNNSTIRNHLLLPRRLVDPISLISFSHDERQLFSASTFILQVWDTSSGNRIKQFCTFPSSGVHPEINLTPAVVIIYDSDSESDGESPPKPSASDISISKFSPPSPTPSSSSSLSSSSSSSFSIGRRYKSSRSHYDSIKWPHISAISSSSSHNNNRVALITSERNSPSYPSQLIRGGNPDDTIHLPNPMKKKYQNRVQIWDVASDVKVPIYEIDLNTGRAPAVFTQFSADDQHIIIQTGNYETIVLDAQTGEQEYSYDEQYSNWTTLSDNSSYALRADGWVCRFSHFSDQAQKLLWIPQQYRPDFQVHRSTTTSPHIKGPLFSLSAQGIQLCLPRTDGSLVTLIIPHEL